MLEKHGDHPVADYVRLAMGVNLSRNFKVIDDRAQGRVRVRPAEISEAASMLTQAAAARSRVDDLSKVTLLERFAHRQRALGDDKGAEASLNQAQAVRGAGRP